jgi:uncharacterized membrane protein (DUF485 family)
MTDNGPATLGNGATAFGRPRALDTILYGGLTVGVLDFLDANIFFGLRGVKPTAIWQFVASGLLGRAAFSGGTKTILLGVALHFAVAFILATIYYLASLALPALIRQAMIWGLLYGVLAHFVMTFVVTRLSAAPPRLRYPVPVMLNGVIGHALLVGLPLALFARRSAKSRNRN